MEQSAILVLEDGTTCYGKAFGAIGTTGVKFVSTPG
jgi:carbamoylphosphate synthase small subunit